MLENGSSYTFIDFRGVTISSSSEESIVAGTLGDFGPLNPVTVGAISVKSSSDFVGLEDKVGFTAALVFAGLARGDGRTLPVVLLAGLV